VGGFQSTWYVIWDNVDSSFVFWGLLIFFFLICGFAFWGFFC